MIFDDFWANLPAKHQLRRGRRGLRNFWKIQKPWKSHILAIEPPRKPLGSHLVGFGLTNHVLAKKMYQNAKYVRNRPTPIRKSTYIYIYTHRFRFVGRNRMGESKKWIFLLLFTFLSTSGYPGDPSMVMWTSWDVFKRFSFFFFYFFGPPSLSISRHSDRKPGSFLSQKTSFFRP